VFVTNHALAGAAIGALVRRPVPAFVIGVASHVLMDMAPHFGGLDVDGPEFLRAARVDGTVGLGVTAAVVAVAPPAVRRSALAGLAGACLIDLDKPSRHFLGRSPFPPAVDRFHDRIQNEVPHGPWTEAATAAALVVAVGAAFRHRRRRGRAVA
jgi:MYXO-CTERM domain-containing protein